MASIILTPSGTGSNYSYASVPSNYPLSNLVGKNSSTTNSYAGFNLKTGSGAASYIFVTFDTSAIPARSTITSIVAKLKLYGTSNTNNRTSTRQIQLYSGSTAKGSAYSFSRLSSSTVGTISDPGTWTREELNDLMIRVYITRSSSNATTTQAVYVMGADITIEYEELPDVTHTVTIQNNGYNVDPTGTLEYFEGATIPITISTNSLPEITLDGSSIKDQFTKAVVETSYSGSPAASTYINIQSGSQYVAYAVGKTAENPYSSTNSYYCNSSTAVDAAYGQYTFDLSSIPSNATNIEVACTVAGHAESTTYSHQQGGRYSVWGLCSNGVAKGSQIYTTSTSNTTISFTDTGTWTRDELDNLQLRHYVGYYGGGTVGVTLSITYSLPGSEDVYTYNLIVSADHIIIFGGGEDQEILYIKDNGSWEKTVKLYKKINGVWIEVNISESGIGQTVFAYKSN